jgi:K+-sensing histidine kinase KdpD
VADQRQSADDLRDRFSVGEILNTVSHDIRAALSVTSGAAHELLTGSHGGGDDMHKQLVAMIQRGNDRLGRLAGNLVHLADLWEGRLELHRSSTALGPLVAAVGEELRQKHGARVKLVVDLPAREVTAVIDADRTRQVLGNILGWSFANARKQVTLRLLAEPGGVVVIEDDGPPRGERGRAVGGEDSGKRVSSVALAYAVSQEVLTAQGGSFSTEVLPDNAGFSVRVAVSSPGVGDRQRAGV